MVAYRTYRVHILHTPSLETRSIGSVTEIRTKFSKREQSVPLVPFCAISIFIFLPNYTLQISIRKTARLRFDKHRAKPWKTAPLSLSLSLELYQIDLYISDILRFDCPFIQFRLILHPCIAHVKPDVNTKVPRKPFSGK